MCSRRNSARGGFCSTTTNLSLPVRGLVRANERILTWRPASVKWGEPRAVLESARLSIYVRQSPPMNRTTRHALAAFTTALLLAPLARLDAAEEKPTQTSRAAAPRPEAGLTREQRIQWWREARFGMFIHWGLYAIPAGVWKDKVHATGYSEWIMFDEKIPAKEYEKLAGKFNPVKFDAKAWAAIAKKAGMKYMVLTTKHHDGFSMFKSRLTPITSPTPRRSSGMSPGSCRMPAVTPASGLDATIPSTGTGIGRRAPETITGRTMSGITPIPERRISTATSRRLRSPRSRNS